MVEEYIDKAVDCLFEVLPDKWERIVLFAEFDERHYNIFFYLRVDGKYYQCYGLDKICRVSEKDIDKVTEEWYKLGMKHKNDETWKYYTVIIDENSKFKVDYVYEDNFDLDNWKHKYLV